MADERPSTKLLAAGYEVELVWSWEREEFISRYAEVLLVGAKPKVAPAPVDPALERDRLAFEMKRWEAEQQWWETEKEERKLQKEEARQRREDEIKRQEKENQRWEAEQEKKEAAEGRRNEDMGIRTGRKETET